MDGAFGRLSDELGCPKGPLKRVVGQYGWVGRMKEAKEVKEDV